MLSISNSTTPECEGRRIRPSPSTENWKEGVDCCSWSGVTCDYETGNVNGLFLSCSFLQDFESGFRSLNLNGNQFEGSLPTSLLNCSGLEVFDVGNNRLHGIFPHWVETLPDLKVFVLRSNSFHGPVRGSFKTNNIFPQLKIFDISRNNFSGPFPTGYIQHFKAMMNMDESEGGRQYIGDQAGFSYNDSLVLAIKGKDIELVMHVGLCMVWSWDTFFCIEEDRDGFCACIVEGE
ncbi:hypothetical protein FEM48_Zijuj02G0027500 [Ziziphus jujuba var. spinosa]|uniref:Leucine-rich repeat-containing N-terminal plant-type domain-containing protein n=1 Tax=Ziziphus jujuba var. spinosa TaxID=714518 RepID=A0A978VT58_ZIZJJ|nr:hypothetical protein FEM48_Zijuj02G0027500 [Ziziphus jujuba var. spinosa]